MNELLSRGHSYNRRCVRNKDKYETATGRLKKNTDALGIVFSDGDAQGKSCITSFSTDFGYISSTLH